MEEVEEEVEEEVALRLLVTAVVQGLSATCGAREVRGEMG